MSLRIEDDELAPVLQPEAIVSEAIIQPAIRWASLSKSIRSGSGVRRVSGSPPYAASYACQNSTASQLRVAH